MDVLNDTVAHARSFVSMSPHQLAITIPLGLCILLILALLPSRNGAKQPPMLPETIPYVTNTLQYLTNMDTFLARAKKALAKGNIVGFRLGGIPFYFLTSPANIQTFFRTSPAIGFERFILIAITNMMGASPSDVAKFADDKSGRMPNPAPGTPDGATRYWYAMQTMMHKYLSTTHYSNSLATTYQRFFGRELDTLFPKGQWTETRIVPLMKDAMAKAAIVSFQGEYIFELTPNLLDLLWEADKVLSTILYGPPKWLYRGVYDKMERLCQAMARYYAAAMEKFDWDNETEREKDWEPVFGSRFWREFAWWMVDEGKFTNRSCGGFVAATGLIASNANTVPVCTWAILEMIRDPGLLERLREEVDSVVVVENGERKFDIQRLVNLPLLQSVYVEVMRLRVSIHVTREVVQPLEVEGYTLKPGSVLQAPTELAHWNEEVWGVEGHPAAEFWAERHVKYADGKAVFEMRGRPTDFFPYGGGVAVCPGRHFAKQEIMLTTAMLASKFDYDFVGWVNMDGSPSDRPPVNDPKYTGGAGVPPDRDMKVRVKRRW
ncbi:hypothetical protein OQA88_5124 [Cercophora sp. LCS_1]